MGDGMMMPPGVGYGFDQDVFQQVSNDIMMNLGQQASNYTGDKSLLAEQLVSLLKKSLSEQFGVQ